MNTQRPAPPNPAGTPARADGYLMLAVAARNLLAGDLVPLPGAWHTISQILVDADEPNVAYLTAVSASGTATRQILADTPLAILRHPAARLITATSNADAAGWRDTPGSAA